MTTPVKIELELIDTNHKDIQLMGLIAESVTIYIEEKGITKHELRSVKSWFNAWMSEKTIGDHNE